VGGAEFIATAKRAADVHLVFGLYFLFLVVVCMFVCLFVFLCFFVSLFLCLLACLLVCFFVCFFVCLFVCLVVCLFVDVSGSLLRTMQVACVAIAWTSEQQPHHHHYHQTAKATIPPKRPTNIRMTLPTTMTAKTTTTSKTSNRQRCCIQPWPTSQRAPSFVPVPHLM
jgi:hypothetical protein